MAVLTLMVLIVAFGVEVGWLMAEPPASRNLSAEVRSIGIWRTWRQS